MSTMKALVAAALLASNAAAILRMTSQVFAETADLTGKCEELYGPGWIMAEWTTLTNFYNGIKMTEALDQCYDEGTAQTPLYMSAFITNIGDEFYASNRRYYFQRFNMDDQTGNGVPANFDSLGSAFNQLIHLGAWSGSRRILCDGPADQDCAANHEWVEVAPDVCYQGTADSCACEQLCMVLHSGWQFNDDSQCCCWA